MNSTTQNFADKDSIVRQIWGKSDTVLFIFAGAAAEFALNKAVDWLYFTGKLPADPLGRLFSTVSYARAILFSDNDAANRAIDSMTNIHRKVEASRGATIPDWAYRDVLFMLIDYSIRSYELLERTLTSDEKTEVFDVFNRLGIRMGLTGLPDNYSEWLQMRDQHLSENLKKSELTDDLFLQYRKHLGVVRYRILVESQMLIVPQTVRQLLGYREISLMKALIPCYKLSRILKLDSVLKAMILPNKYKKQIKAIDTYAIKRCPFGP